MHVARVFRVVAEVSLWCFFVVVRVFRLFHVARVFWLLLGFSRLLVGHSVWLLGCFGCCFVVLCVV